METKTYTLLDESKITALKRKLRQQGYKQVADTYWVEIFVKYDKQIIIKRYI